MRSVGFLFRYVGDYCEGFYSRCLKIKPCFTVNIEIPPVDHFMFSNYTLKSLGSRVSPLDTLWDGHKPKHDLVLKYRVPRISQSDRWTTQGHF